MELSLLVFGFIVAYISVAPSDARYCRETYQCLRTCSRQSMYYTKCGWWTRRCAKYRTTYYSCYKTCSRNVCCAGWTGTGCSTAICYGSTSCLNGNSCIGPNNCNCRAGYLKPRCQDTNECSTSNGGCEHSCSNTAGSFQCSCRNGYTLSADKKTCNDNNECSSSNGGCQHVCSNTQGSFQCSCNAGYVLASDKKTCQDNNECSSSNGGCQHVCSNTQGSFQCSCNAGYVLASDKKTCQDVDECTDGTSLCSQTCTNTVGSYECGCDVGYELGADGVTCSDIDDCEGVSCQNGGVCVDKVAAFECSCARGYTGTYCEAVFGCVVGSTCDINIGYELEFHTDCTKFCQCAPSGTNLDGSVEYKWVEQPCGPATKWNSLLGTGTCDHAVNVDCEALEWSAHADAIAGTADGHAATQVSTTMADIPTTTSIDAIGNAGGHAATKVPTTTMADIPTTTSIDATGNAVGHAATKLPTTTKTDKPTTTSIKTTTAAETAETRNGLQCEADGDCQGADANAVCIYQNESDPSGLCMCNHNYIYSERIGSCRLKNPCPARLCDSIELVGVAPGCQQFCQCGADNHFSVASCPPGLVFSNDIGACNWEDQVNVQTCTAA